MAKPNRAWELIGCEVLEDYVIATRIPACIIAWTIDTKSIEGLERIKDSDVNFNIFLKYNEEYW